jgi:hypothetical protein
LCLQWSIDYIFAEAQHIVITGKFLPRFKYDQSKVEKYQFALTTNLGNLWVANSTKHLGPNGLVDLLQQSLGVITKSTFGSKLSEGQCRKRYYHKP